MVTVATLRQFVLADLAIIVLVEQCKHLLLVRGDVLLGQHALALAVVALDHTLCHALEARLFQRRGKLFDSDLAAIVGDA